MPTERTALHEHQNPAPTYEEGNTSNKTDFRLYKIRWLFLATVACQNMATTMITVSFSPVATLATQYYKVSGNEIDLIAIVPWAFNAAGMFLAIYSIGRFKLLTSIRYATTMTLAGSIVRAVSTAFSGDTIDFRTQFWITFIGQMIVALGAPITVTMSTVVSQTWFGEKERAISTPIMGLSPVLGGMIGQAVSPIVLQDNPDKVPILNIVTASPFVVTSIISWIALRSAIPPTPPSRSAELQLSQNHATFRELARDFWAVLKSRAAFTVAICQGCGAGLINTLLTQLNQLMCSRNYTTTESSLTAVANIAAGFVGAFSINLAAKKYGTQIEASKVCYSLACLSTIFMLMGVDRTDSIYWIAITFGGFGFFGYAAFPMSLELAAEDTYPLDASLSESIVHVVASTSAITMVLTGNYLYWDLPEGSPNTCQDASDNTGADDVGVEARDYTPYLYMMMALATVLSTIFIIFMSPKMKRSNEDHVTRGK